MNGSSIFGIGARALTGTVIDTFSTDLALAPFVEGFFGSQNDCRIFRRICQVVFDKKWGILIKKKSKSLIFTGLKIPRDYTRMKRNS